MSSRRYSPILKSLFLLLFWMAGSAHGAAADVVVSIKPIHSLVAGVMHGVAVPQLLIPGAQSPHTYHLKPSDVRKLAAAGLVVWVGESLETPLEQVLEANAQQAQILEIMEIPGLLRLPPRRGGIWAEHGHDDHEKAHRHDEVDNHVWLSPENGATIVTAVAERLSTLDPEHADHYRQNAARLTERIGRLDATLKQDLASIADRPYIVFHDAYQYFEQHFGLHGVGSVTASPEQLPGARRIHALREVIRQRGAVCLFSEPQFEPRLAKTLTAGTQVRSTVLDPLGVALQPGPELYFELLGRLGESLKECLSDKRE